MVKAKFREEVRSKHDVPIENEVLCKLLCRNIYCIVSPYMRSTRYQKFLCGRFTIEDNHHLAWYSSKVKPTLSIFFATNIETLLSSQRSFANA
jgi:hypothetical protein